MSGPFDHDALANMLTERFGEGLGLPDRKGAPEKSEAIAEPEDYAALFGSALGRQVLMDLIARTIHSPAWTPGSDASHGYFREGQNSITNFIIDQMREATAPANQEDGA